MVPVASGVPSPKSTVYWRGRPVGSEAVTKSDVAKGAVPVEVVEGMPAEEPPWC